MVFRNLTVSSELIKKSMPLLNHQTRWISSLKVVWKKDTKLDEAIELRQALQPLRSRRQRSSKRATPSHPPQVPRKAPRETAPQFQSQELRRDEPFPLRDLPRSDQTEVGSRSVHPPRATAEKLVHLKRDFGFRNDFLVRLVKKYPNYFRLTGLAGEGGKEETVRTGVPVRLNFDVKLPSGFFVRKEMREWTRETTYRLTRMCLVWTKRLRRWRDEPLVLERVFFTRHSGIFYLSLKGGIKTAVLREAYRDEELIDRDPLVAVKEKFLRLLEEGWQERKDRLRKQREQVEKDREILLAAKKQQEPEERLCD
ncbi:hypothetical protein F2Q69_00049800 [Brassica cretica]|uniref:PORR domain-containing protein n=1 Tax=Brassica cretica TaxID=69181 RepID=A0A8S9Q1E0_BRACR|nr:hypothetical protein F2Q69_00049800 [Brassica cretica]